MSKIRVYCTQISECCGPVVWKNIKDVLTEVEEMLPEVAVGDSFTITVEEMEEEEFDNLEEFAGY